jgi:putative sigma-54 modulation protein
MKVTITARHCEISPELREQANAQLENMQKEFDKISRADVIFLEDGPTPQAEITIQSYRHLFNAKGKGASHEQALGVAVEKAERQIRKFKDKLIGRREVREKEKETPTVA